MVHTFNLGHQEIVAGGFLGIWGQAGLQSEFLDSQSYTKKHSLKKPNQNKKAHIYLNI